MASERTQNTQNTEITFGDRNGRGGYVHYHATTPLLRRNLINVT